MVIVVRGDRMKTRAQDFKIGKGVQKAVTHYASDH